MLNRHGDSFILEKITLCSEHIYPASIIYKGLTKDLSRIYVGEIDHIYYNKHDIQLSC